MTLHAPLPTTYTAQSKRYFYCRDVVCEFAFRQGYVPLNPFRAFDYFLGERVERDLIRRANFNLIRISDELWVFGHIIADGVLAEIQYAKALQKPCKFFSVGTRVRDIHPLSTEILRVERDSHKNNKDAAELLRALLADGVINQPNLFDTIG
jgi:hypothetical protein